MEPWVRDVGEIDQAAVSDAVGQLLGRSAIEGHDSTLDVGPHDEPWAWMLKCGYVRVESGDPGATPPVTVHVQLSDSGMKQMTTGVLYDTSVPLFEPRRSIPLKELTGWELGMLLKIQR